MLQKYLKSSRQQLPQLLPSLPESLSPSQQIVDYLATCLKYDISPLAFLQRFYSGQNAVFEERNWLQKTENLISLKPDKNQSKGDQSLNNGLTAEQGKTRSGLGISYVDMDDFENWSLICDDLSSRMIRHGTEFLLRKNDISLFVTITNIPNFAITEEVINPQCNKFIISSETCV